MSRGPVTHSNVHCVADTPPCSVASPLSAEQLSSEPDMSPTKPDPPYSGNRDAGRPWQLSWQTRRLPQRAPPPVPWPVELPVCPLLRPRAGTFPAPLLAGWGESNSLVPPRACCRSFVASLPVDCGVPRSPIIHPLSLAKRRRSSGFVRRSAARWSVDSHCMRRSPRPEASCKKLALRAMCLLRPTDSAF